MTRRASSAVLLLALALPGAAVAADEVVGVLAVGEPPGPTPELAAATEQLRAALAGSMPGVVGAAELRQRMTGPPPPATFAELKRAHAGAVAAYTAGEFESSVKTLRAVAEALEALPESADVFAQWTETMLRLARTEQELGRRVEAQTDLERLLRAAPDAKPDGRWYPPSFLALVEGSRERLRAVGTRRLAVEADPGVRVFVDGREVGAGPVEVSLPPGSYRVAGERDGVRTRAVVADLSQDDRSVELDLRSAAAMRPEVGPGLAVAAAERPLRVVTAAARLGLDRAVATSLVRDGDATLLVATAYEVRGGKAEREGRIRMEGGVPPPGAIWALAAFVATGRASALVSTPAGPSLALHVPPRRRSSRRRRRADRPRRVRRCSRGPRRAGTGTSWRRSSRVPWRPSESTARTTTRDARRRATRSRAT